jgi:flagellar biosynthesis protein FlhB
MPGEKSEAPTPKRLRDARKRGEVAKSQELVTVGVLLAAAGGMRWIGPDIAHYLQESLRHAMLRPAETELTAQSAISLARTNAFEFLLAMLPFFGLLVLAAVAFNVVQTGFLLSGQKLKPKLSNISPKTGLRRIYGMEGLVNLLRALFKMGVVAGVAGFTMYTRLDDIVMLGAEPVSVAVGTIASLAFDIALRIIVVLFILTLLDYLWQRRQHIKRLRMTKHDVKQEFKESEGDPQIRAALKQKRQSMLNRMIAEVPDADVVVTNPVHYAVALKYDPVSMSAPVVVAKGERLLAQRIKEVARNAGVPVLEEPPLARALFKAVSIGSPIPANLYQAVAEVLAWVYALRGKGSSANGPTAFSTEGAT